MATAKTPLFEQVAKQLIEQMEKGTSPFQQPWKDDVASVLPYNPTTQKPYKGLNTMWLMMQGHSDPRWLTFKQAQSNGWTVEKGAKGTLINYVKTHSLVKLIGEDGKPIIDQDGKQKVATVKLDRPLITSAYVFNAEKIKGIPPLEIPKQEQGWDNLKRVEKLVKNSGVSLQHGGNSAYYNLITDKITMPKKTQFDTASKYYSVLIHEMGHWTGHENRLNRPMLSKFGTPDYAKEELRAEIASLMIGGDLNLGRDFSEHASYIKSWVKILKDEPFELYKASAEAQKIRDYILQFENKRAVKVTNTRAESLQKNDVILFEGEKYQVSRLLPAKKLALTNLSTGMTFRLAPDDKLYAQLIEAKTQAIEQGLNTPKNKVEEQGRFQQDDDNDQSINRFKR